MASSALPHPTTRHHYLSGGSASNGWRASPCARAVARATCSAWASRSEFSRTTTTLGGSSLSPAYPITAFSSTNSKPPKETLVALCWSSILAVSTSACLPVDSPWPPHVLHRTGRLASCAIGPRRRPNCSTHKPCPAGPASRQRHQAGRPGTRLPRLRNDSVNYSLQAAPSLTPAPRQSTARLDHPACAALKALRRPQEPACFTYASVARGSHVWCGHHRHRGRSHGAQDPAWANTGKHCASAAISDIPCLPTTAAGAPEFCAQVRSSWQPWPQALAAPQQ